MTARTNAWIKTGKEDLRITVIFCQPTGRRICGGPVSARMGDERHTGLKRGEELWETREVRSVTKGKGRDSVTGGARRKERTAAKMKKERRWRS